MPDDILVIEVFGEGKTDVRKDEGPRRPDRGVVAIVVHTICGRPERMKVKSGPLPFLQGRTLSQKVRFAKRQAAYNRSAGVVVVVDAEGGDRQRKKQWRALDDGRQVDAIPTPVAIGVAQPCIEAWLLADAAAIQQALNLAARPTVPERPEALPAPCEDDRGDPKRVLADAAGTHGRISRPSRSGKSPGP